MPDKTPVILAVNRVSFLGGVERVIVSCGVAAQQRGLHTIVGCPEPGELGQEARRRGLEVRPLAINRSKATTSPLTWARLLASLWQGQRQVTRVARERNVTLLHAHHPISALYALHAARTLHLPLLLHVHETLPVHSLYRAVARHVIPSCAGFACVSAQSRKMITSLGAPALHARLIYNGVDPTFQGQVVEVADLVGSGPHVGIFGVLEPRKGQDVFVQAARQVAARHPGAQFWIVGEQSFAENAAYVAGLRSAIAAAELTGRVHLTGFRRDVRDWMAGMHAIVLASRDREALPTVLIEGALLGRPLVATAVGGVREIIDHGVSGLVVPPGDVDVLAQAILRALGPESAGFGDAAQAAAKQRFTFERFGDDMAALYHELLAGMQPAGAARRAA